MQKNVPFKWTHECQSNFDKFKQSLDNSVALAYPDFMKPFIIHTDASKYQLGAVISQETPQVHLIAFYSHKLTDHQAGTPLYCRNAQGIPYHPLWTFNCHLH